MKCKRTICLSKTQSHLPIHALEQSVKGRVAGVECAWRLSRAIGLTQMLILTWH